MMILVLGRWTHSKDPSMHSFLRFFPDLGRDFSHKSLLQLGDDFRGFPHTLEPSIFFIFRISKTWKKDKTHDSHSSRNDKRVSLG